MILKNLMKQKGYSMMSAILTVAMTTVIASTLLSLIINEYGSLGRYSAQTQAYYLAKKGISAAVDNLNKGGDGNVDVEESPTKSYKTEFNQGTNTIKSEGVIVTTAYGGSQREVSKEISVRLKEDEQTEKFNETFSTTNYKDNATTAYWGEGALKAGRRFEHVGSIGSGNIWEDFIWDMDFVNSTTGYVAAMNGILYKTTDGGVTWNPSLETGRTLHAVQFINENVGFVGLSALEYGKILKTSDGGNTWREVYSKNQVVYYGGTNIIDLNFPSETTGYAVGYQQVDRWYNPNPYRSIILKTTGLNANDLGESWTELPNPAPYSPMGQVSFKDNQNGCFATERNQLFVSSDGGNSWNSQDYENTSGNPFEIIYDEDGIWDSFGDLGSWGKVCLNGEEKYSSRLRKMDKMDDNTYYIASNSPPVVYVTDDNGFNWQSIKNDINSHSISAVMSTGDVWTGNTLGQVARLEAATTAQSIKIADTNTPVRKAKVVFSRTDSLDTSQYPVRFYVSANGTDFKEVDSNGEAEFIGNEQGTTPKWKAILTADITNSPIVDEVTVYYTSEDQYSIDYSTWHSD